MSLTALSRSLELVHLLLIAAALNQPDYSVDWSEDFPAPQDLGEFLLHARGSSETDLSYPLAS